MCPVFDVGQKVVCIRDRGYHLTVGKAYEVLHYTPRYRHENGHVDGAYVTFIDDIGEKRLAHSTRFKAAD